MVPALAPPQAASHMRGPAVGGRRGAAGPLARGRARGLIVCPQDLITQWITEIRRFYGEEPVHPRSTSTRPRSGPSRTVLDSIDFCPGCLASPEDG